MPTTFESFGVRFLYPDNWIEIENSGQTITGVTLELPSGGFFSVDQQLDDVNGNDLLEEIERTLIAEYSEVEREDVILDNAIGGERTIELRFYYLDLLIVSRVVLLGGFTPPLVLQMQAEARDFDSNEKVFEAILQQLRDQA